MHVAGRLIWIAATFAACGCAYVGTMTKQSYYAIRQSVAPSQRVTKHMVERDTFFVYGEIATRASAPIARFAVVALGENGSKLEVVDVNAVARDGSFYGMHLPEGTFLLTLVADRDGDGICTEREVVGSRVVSLGATELPDRVLGGFDLDVGSFAPSDTRAPSSFDVSLPALPTREESLFFPKGTLRSLDDPIFSPEFATVGLYEPAAFLERAPMMFYALEEDCGYKVPVIFVHGIDGSARQFIDIIAAMDRSRYQPWFFDYPSGGDLDQLSAMFYRIFLSGKVIPRQEMPMVIVAHSMGGLIVRDAFNRMMGNARENRVATLVTIASPLGGHPSARASRHAPVLLPSWVDLNPDSEFIGKLHRRLLPRDMRYSLFYTYADSDLHDEAKATDGVVPLTSQITQGALHECTVRRGFASTHMGVLQDGDAIHAIVQEIEAVQSVFPEEHLRVLDLGGYDLQLGAEFSPIEVFMVRRMGHYMDALVSGELQPFHPEQEDFVRACRGEIKATNPAATAWLKLRRTRDAAGTASRN